ncbi:MULTISPECIES: trimeric intracellular cation channel family protein [Commensalibacter]|uniref:Trimeric intracellular cation channel family protein n=1 Tax=Commensalibacter melissae TaxID=2070537 RepID=A0A318MUJ9_9PROT|nr:MULTISPECIES: trimeric intracellular cation channel family protein [Commensalibacter]MCT6843087.1 trimeric intracellular cation channel family protein [Commensalibacter sp.]AYN86107.1 trimeric intracellular cation channel family protein [Commensalibacter melissae]MBH9970664.1 trimeric intracellular cation channel family protein [Commensalibacter sp. M0265]MBH9974020.1 trimeric intracellular cation channel family protein [Commensalibacter melissae]MBH9978010.1 trimeric intracellular cation c
MSHTFFHYVDLIGTFAFAISGALAAINRNLDIFGVFCIAFVTACGGGIVRDICIGSFPLAGMMNLEYLVIVLTSVFLAAFFQKLLLHLNHPTLFFDAIGLGFFASFGAHKAFVFTGNCEISIFLGTLTAIGGGILRDTLTALIPSVLTKEIYASAAIGGAIVQIMGDKNIISPTFAPWFAIIICSAIRLLSLKFKWNLPSIKQIQ